ncbi:hypothetical protein CEXT_440891 [Caerostris extrusa]|uniref:Ycf15 n=1 Tax=Caerostris extrusa TaxID=172846 RepID=A0AAV4R3W7_CAEEX|nr:hypothetical protein CEXT_440891 [Caerostris extrusa]
MGQRFFSFKEKNIFGSNQENSGAPEQIDRPISSVGLERRANNAKVAGSIPSWANVSFLLKKKKYFWIQSREQWCSRTDRPAH